MNRVQNPWFNIILYDSAGCVSVSPLPPSPPCPSYDVLFFYVWERIDPSVSLKLLFDCDLAIAFLMWLFWIGWCDDDDDDMFHLLYIRGRNIGRLLTLASKRCTLYKENQMLWNGNCAHPGCTIFPPWHESITCHVLHHHQPYIKEWDSSCQCIDWQGDDCLCILDR